MKREDALNLFLSLALRPHRHCIYNISRAPPKLIRYASTSTQDKTTPLPGQGADPKGRPVIPLHVGLDRNPENVSAISRIPIPRGVTGEKFTPSVLARPLGLQQPPRQGENSPLDVRTLRERHQEFTSYEKALERRRVYLRTFFRPYFQEWRRMDHHKGKSFVSSPRLFRRDKALYLPNIWGQTLAEEGDGSNGGRDTTPLLLGKVSILSMQANAWAEEMVASFIGEKSNPDLTTLMEQNKGRLQRVDVNIQGDWMRALIVRFFTRRLRKLIPQERWSRYFMIKLPRDIRRGLTDETRDAMGMLNSQVGYVYLIDSSCKIRWAGSGYAWEGEVDGLNAAVQRLLQEEKDLGRPSPKSSSLPPSNTIQRPRVTPKIPTEKPDTVPRAVAA
ncbi:Mitochondrial ATPase complex subunit atp10 [Cladophialophora chaetospira]|uniref:Mitochondrial ATPase complex subunit atp10 n=1 Tax=Cladophialophora chaetospira TaxID=386627 RepID=A0AA38X6S9_9EURO|nr:Mitochondrial ATPase complex subunit atp10 [Cladophialophora chaetospira]